MKSHAYSLSILSILLAGCVLIPKAQPPMPNELRLPSYDDFLPDGLTHAGTPSARPSSSSTPVGNLVLNLSQQYGIRLSNQEIAQLQAMSELQPNGRWARTSDKTSEENLLANYTRFAPLFDPRTPDTAEEYRLRAVTFAEKTSVPLYFDVAYYQTNKRMLISKWSEETGEFVVIQPDGSLVNYLISRAIEPPRYLKVEL